MSSLPSGRYQILWRGHPSIWQFYLSLIFGVLFAPILVGYGLLFNAYCLWRGTSYVVAAQKVGIERGIFVTSTRELRISDIRSIEVRRSGLSGFFGIGDVILSSAARDDSTVKFAGISATETIADLIRDLQEGHARIALFDGKERVWPFWLSAFVALALTSATWTWSYRNWPDMQTLAASAAPAASVRQSSSPSAGQLDASEESTIAPTPVPVPSFTPYTPAPAAFLTDVGYSKQAAGKKHPTVGVPGSPLNKTYLARLQQWRTSHDPRLDRSDWPEVLADDCEAHP